MSETSAQLRSQISLGAGNISLDSDGNPIPAIGLTQARKHAKEKPRFIEFACSHIEVLRYVALVTMAIIPKSFWGSKTNLKLVLGCKFTLFMSESLLTHLQMSSNSSVARGMRL
ncbi:hypothetical protein BJ912DRAFT_861753 [Pholiota molesta]|nr:hypothetical protein BJ912DRAFT_861753 [Pholiota molesta]